MAIFQAFYLALRKDGESPWLRGILLVAGLWMTAFLVIFAFMTGIVILIATTAVLVIYMALSRPGWSLKIATLAVVTAGFVVSGYFLLKIWGDVARAEPVDFRTLESSTSLGNSYWHDTTNTQVENGHHVWIYISSEELREAWNQRSSYDFDGQDKAGQDLRFTLIRFLASKGYRKDAGGVAKLTGEEVAMVENGIASIIYSQRSPLYVRIYKTFWEFQQYRTNRNASGHSMMQRIEYWRTAAAIARDHQSWLVGIGTGDLDDAFQLQYEKMGSMLGKEFRWRTHNQFLSIFVTFGLLGLLWFLFALIFPGTRLRKFSDFFYLTFFIIFILSMVTEDTLETQAGVTQFAFFTSFYLFSRKFINLV
jgi:O-antigen ligase